MQSELRALRSFLIIVLVAQPVNSTAEFQSLFPAAAAAADSKQALGKLIVDGWLSGKKQSDTVRGSLENKEEQKMKRRENVGHLSGGHNHTQTMPTSSLINSKYFKCHVLVCESIIKLWI